MKKLFKIFFLIGILIILILSFVIPDNPFKIIPAISIGGIDRPLWLNILIFYGFIYSIILNVVYEIIENKF